MTTPAASAPEPIAGCAPAAPGVLHGDARPPIASEAEPAPGAAAPYRVLRPTAAVRPTVAPVIWADALSDLGYPPEHPYVRRYWTAALGPGAVADLLRLAVAARRGRSLPLPVNLPALIAAGLVHTRQGRIRVRATVPPLPAFLVRRLPPFLRREHAALRWARPHQPGVRRAGGNGGNPTHPG
jgi:hypothetical protein